MENEKNVLPKNRWINSLSVVKFDIDQGQIVELQWNYHEQTQESKKLLSLLSFPDSNAFYNNEGTLKYIFKMKNQKEIGQLQQYSYGFVYFIQKKDKNLQRGYFQKSVVIQSAYPLVSFFLNLVEFLGQKYFEQNDEKFLKNVWSQMQNWPNIQSDQIYELQLSGQLFLSQIPQDEQFEISNNQNSISKNTPLNLVLQMQSLKERGYFADVNLYQLLGDKFKCLIWKLWEIALTNMQLLIVSDSPSQCSQIVLGIISLISPLSYQGEFRPYFTIYDPDYRLFAQNYEGNKLKNIIIGVTNPLFLKTMKKFPIILHLENEFNENLYKQKKGLHSDPHNYLLSSEKLCISQDDNTLKNLLPANSDETAAINNSLIQKSIEKLNTDFFKVFQDYLSSQRNVNKFNKQRMQKHLIRKYLPNLYPIMTFLSKISFLKNLKQQSYI